jgi:hypothetical protein
MLLPLSLYIDTMHEIVAIAVRNIDLNKKKLPAILCFIMIFRGE